jgi:hypothetical protein
MRQMVARQGEDRLKSADPASHGVSPWLLRYVVAVDVCALAALAVSVRSGFPADAGTFSLVAALAALAGLRPVRFARFKTELTATHPFVLLAVAVLGPIEAMLVAVIGLTGVIVRPGRRLDPMRTAFNLGAVTLASAAASSTFLAFGGAVGGTLWESFGPLAALNDGLGLLPGSACPHYDGEKHRRPTYWIGPFG